MDETLVYLKALKSFINLPEGICLRDIRFSETLNTDGIQEQGPGHGVGVSLAHFRQNVIDVLLENRVQSYETYLVRAQIFTLSVKKIGYSLKEHRGLTASCDTLDQ